MWSIFFIFSCLITLDKTSSVILDGTLGADISNFLCMLRRKSWQLCLCLGEQYHHPSERFFCFLSILFSSLLGSFYYYRFNFINWFIAYIQTTEQNFQRSKQERERYRKETESEQDVRLVHKIHYGYMDTKIKIQRHL